MNAFETYFEPEKVIGLLVRWRMDLARRRHDLHFFRNISASAKNPALAANEALEILLPPRKQWPRLRLDERIGRDRENVASRGACRLILGRMRAGTLTDTPWGCRLMAFLDEVKTAALDGRSYQVTEPEITAVPKGKGVCRPIVRYDRLLDRVVLSLGARYLRDFFDPSFLPCAHAFRAGNGYSHHAAAESLLQFRQAHGPVDLYASECDIKKFYDIIAHDVVIASLDRACHRLGAVPDARVRALLDKFLNSYTFPRVGLKKGLEDIERRHMHGRIEWLSARELKALHGMADIERIGIPQGGAFSGLIANLVLDAADRAVMGDGTNPGLCYVRFCDDSLILHTDRELCEQASDRYLEALHTLRLAPYNPVAVSRYGRGFYTMKSKRTYCWGEPRDRKKVTPWIAFVGYEIRFDGLLRVRKTSVKKQMKSMIRLVSTVAQLLRSNPGAIRRSSETIAHRVEARMTSEGVGRADLRFQEGRVESPCWADGFALLNGHESDDVQMRALDRMRGRQLCRLKRHLCRRLDEGKRQFQNGHCGAPYSYFGHFNHEQTKVIYRKNTWQQAYEG